MIYRLTIITMVTLAFLIRCTDWREKWIQFLYSAQGQIFTQLCTKQKVISYVLRISYSFWLHIISPESVIFPDFEFQISVSTPCLLIKNLFQAAYRVLKCQYALCFTVYESNTQTDLKRILWLWKNNRNFVYIRGKNDEKNISSKDQYCA